MEQTLLKILTDFGYPIALNAAVFWVFWKYIMKVQNDGKLREDRLMKFIETQNRALNNTTKGMSDITKALEGMNQKIDTLWCEVRDLQYKRSDEK